MHMFLMMRNHTCIQSKTADSNLRDDPCEPQVGRLNQKSLQVSIGLTASKQNNLFFSHSSFYTQQSLHTDVLQANAFTQRISHTERLLNKAVSFFYTEGPVHTAVFTQKKFPLKQV